jgi:hypothetical protein
VGAPSIVAFALQLCDGLQQQRNMHGNGIVGRVSVERILTRADLPTPRLIRDGMDATWNPADGKHYDSKSAYYSAVKAKGYEIAGNDSSISAAHEKPAPPPKTAPGLKDALKQAWDANT